MFTSKNLYFLCIHLWIIYEIPSSLAQSNIYTTVLADSSTGNPPPPPQEACQTRKAIFYSSDVISKMPKDWVVTRTTQRTKLPEMAKVEPDINCCSPMNWLGSCAGGDGGIHIHRDWDRDASGSQVKITKAYSKKFNNIVEFWEPQGRVDTNYIIFGGFGRINRPPFLLHPIYSGTLIIQTPGDQAKWFELLKAPIIKNTNYEVIQCELLRVRISKILVRIHTKGESKAQEIPSYEFPALVIYVQARIHAITQYGYRTSTGEILWVLYQSCEENMAWIEVASSVINNNELDAVNASIDDSLLKAQSPVPEMVFLPLGLPFKTDS